jgi:hypothetical protein
MGKEMVIMHKLTTAIRAAFVVACLLASVTACHHGSGSSAAAKASASAAVSALANSSAGIQAQSVVKDCLAKNPPTSLASLKLAETCAVPAGHKKAAESCIVKGILGIPHAFTTAKARTELMAESCLVGNR